MDPIKHNSSHNSWFQVCPNLVSHALACLHTDFTICPEFFLCQILTQESQRHPFWLSTGAVIISELYLSPTLTLTRIVGCARSHGLSFVALLALWCGSTCFSTVKPARVNDLPCCPLQSFLAVYRFQISTFNQPQVIISIVRPMLVVSVLIMLFLWPLSKQQLRLLFT